MKKLTLAFLLVFLLKNASAQPGKIVSVYLEGQYNSTIQDLTKGNNPWGVGAGLQAFLYPKGTFRLTGELTADIFLVDDKVLRTDGAGNTLPDVRSMVNMFVGVSISPVKPVYVSVMAGPSFAGGQTLFGIKPSLGFYFSRSKKWTAKLSYIDVFNRGNTIKEDFSSFSFAVGVKLF